MKKLTFGCTHKNLENNTCPIRYGHCEKCPHCKGFEMKKVVKSNSFTTYTVYKETGKVFSVEEALELIKNGKYRRV